MSYNVQRFIGLNQFYNKIKSSNLYSPTTTNYFGIFFEDPYMSNFFRQEGNRVELFDLRYFIQSIAIGNQTISLRSYDQEGGFNNQAIKNIGNIQGSFVSLNNGMVKFAGDSLNIAILTTQRPLLQEFIYRWILQCNSCNISKQNYWGYTLPRVDIIIKYWRADQMRKNMQGVQPQYVYKIIGAFPYSMTGTNTDLSNFNGENTRTVSFGYNQIFILPNKNFAKLYKMDYYFGTQSKIDNDKIISGLQSLQFHSQDSLITYNNIDKESLTGNVNVFDKISGIKQIFNKRTQKLLKAGADLNNIKTTDYEDINLSEISGINDVIRQKFLFGTNNSNSNIKFDENIESISSLISGSIIKTDNSGKITQVRSELSSFAYTAYIDIQNQIKTLSSKYVQELRKYNGDTDKINQTLKNNLQSSMTILNAMNTDDVISIKDSLSNNVQQIKDANKQAEIKAKEQAEQAKKILEQRKIDEQKKKYESSISSIKSQKEKIDNEKTKLEKSINTSDLKTEKEKKDSAQKKLQEIRNTLDESKQQLEKLESDKKSIQSFKDSMSEEQYEKAIKQIDTKINAQKDDINSKQTDIKNAETQYQTAKEQYNKKVQEKTQLLKVAKEEAQKNLEQSSKIYQTKQQEQQKVLKQAEKAKKQYQQAKRLSDQYKTDESLKALVEVKKQNSEKAEVTVKKSEDEILKSKEAIKNAQDKITQTNFDLAVTNDYDSADKKLKNLENKSKDLETDLENYNTGIFNLELSTKTNEQLQQSIDQLSKELRTLRAQAIQDSSNQTLSSQISEKQNLLDRLSIEQRDRTK